MNSVLNISNCLQLHPRLHQGWVRSGKSRARVGSGRTGRYLGWGQSKLWALSGQIKSDVGHMCFVADCLQHHRSGQQIVLSTTSTVAYQPVMKSPILLDSTHKPSMHRDPTRHAGQKTRSSIFEYPISWVGPTKSPSSMRVLRARADSGASLVSTLGGGFHQQSRQADGPT